MLSIVPACWLAHTHIHNYTYTHTDIFAQTKHIDTQRVGYMGGHTLLSAPEMELIKQALSAAHEGKRGNVGTAAFKLIDTHIQYTHTNTLPLGFGSLLCLSGSYFNISPLDKNVYQRL